MKLTIDTATARTALVESIDSVVTVVEGFPEEAFFAPSRCYGWDRLDVVTHLVAGWHELIGGLAWRVDGPATADAASFWPAFTEGEAGTDPVARLMWMRRRSAEYARPADAVRDLKEVGEIVVGALPAELEGFRRWCGQVTTVGDLLTCWAVENAVHHLDLRVETPPSVAATRLARLTVEELNEGVVPAAWTDEQVALVGSGRIPGDGSSTVHAVIR